jgi:sialate O-acetylesterase
MIWYHGEADLFNAPYYKRMLPKLFADLRYKWQQGDIPILLVQLPNYSIPDCQPSESLWAEFREAQAEIAKEVGNTHLIVTADTAKRTPVPLHPSEKKLVGKRLAMAALVVSSGRPGQAQFDSPEFESLKTFGRSVKIRFKCRGQRLVLPGQGLHSLAIAGKDKRFYWASLHLDPNGTDVVASAPDVPNPVAVRYAWGDNPDCSLYSTGGLPVIPFRSDRWSPKYGAYENARVYDFTGTSGGAVVGRPKTDEPTYAPSPASVNSLQP